MSTYSASSQQAAAALSKKQQLPNVIHKVRCQETDDKSLVLNQNNFTTQIKCSPFWCHLHSHLSCIAEQREGSRAPSVVRLLARSVDRLGCSTVKWFTQLIPTSVTFHASISFFHIFLPVRSHILWCDGTKKKYMTQRHLPLYPSLQEQQWRHYPKYKCSRTGGGGTLVTANS